MDKFLYGIDFGTTNSALSIFNEEKNEILTTIIVPSILYFPVELKPTKEIRYFVGDDAIQEYIKDNMVGRFMKSIKRILPRNNFTETRIYGHKLNASDLVSLILKDLKKKADKIIGFDCQKAVIGRPVFFDDDDKTKDNLAQIRLKTAAENAGFKNIVFQFEPIGAAFAYERSINKKENVLVADLGGGTSDFTFIQLDPKKAKGKNRRDDIIATGGIYIGGDSFDSEFMWQTGTPHFGKGVLYESMPGKMIEVPNSLFSNICSWEKMNFYNGWKIRDDLQGYYVFSKNSPALKNLITLIENNLGYSVFQAIEKTKIQLSDSDNSLFFYSKRDIEINEEISLYQYNDIIGRDVLKISNYLDDFFIKNNIHPEGIDSLFLTGGTSLVQVIKELFKTKFPHVPIHTGDNFISVAKGLAFSGYLFE